MSHTMGIVSGDLFADLRADSCAGVKELFVALKEHERVEAVLLARKAELVAAVADHVARRQLVEEKAGGKGIFSFATREAALLELGPALGVSSRGAEVALSFAENMTEKFPLLGQKLAAGEVTAKTARFVGEQLGFAPAQCREELDSWLSVQAPRWRMHSYGKVSQLMEAQYLRLDPDWCKQRRERAHKQRGFFITPISDGMADLRGTMPLEDAAELREKLDRIANTVCPHDPRPVWTRRGDALAILGEETQLVCECRKPSCEAAKRPVRHAKNIELIVQLPALLNKKNIPARLDGAPIDTKPRPQARQSSPAHPLHHLPHAIQTHTGPGNPHQHPRPTLPIPRLPPPNTDRVGPHNPLQPRESRRRGPGRPRKHEETLQTPPQSRGACLNTPGFALRVRPHVQWRDKQSPDGAVHWTSPSGQHYATTPG